MQYLTHLATLRLRLHYPLDVLFIIQSLLVRGQVGVHQIIQLLTSLQYPSGGGKCVDNVVTVEYFTVLCVKPWIQPRNDHTRK